MNHQKFTLASRGLFGNGFGGIFFATMFFKGVSMNDGLIDG
ncbi:hypothetical protein ACQV18_07480 [Facklamia sp. P9177]